MEKKGFSEAVMVGKRVKLRIANDTNYFSTISFEDKKLRIVSRVKLNHLESIKSKDLQQKASVKWLKFGDENSSFFHKMVSINSAKNRIQGLVFQNRMVMDPVELKEEIRLWFKKHFAEPIRRRPDFLKDRLPILTENNGRILCAQFSEKEVFEALRSCDGGKAPGPDGFSLKFFKAFWGKFIGNILEVMNEFYLTGRISNGCNSSFVALIPKVKDPQNISNFRPLWSDRYTKLLPKR
ncbi:putative RNA-directed DNA polymerase [Helianthus debilis subsp. tardiflorus]